MTNALSLYLDALRFGAAFVVFVSHYVAERYTGGLFWQGMPYGRTAVLVFFVLSGFGSVSRGELDAKRGSGFRHPLLVTQL